jgi:hypothetical protein
MSLWIEHFKEVHDFKQKFDLMILGLVGPHLLTW